jgi:hypothetical protein
MKLTHSIYQEKGGPFQSLEITVDYSHRTVNEIISVVAYEFGKERIDISDLFMKHFEGDLNKLIDQIDWPQLAAEYEVQKREFISELENE